MCNEWAQERAWRAYCEMMAREALDIQNSEPLELPFGSMRPSDPAPIIVGTPGGSRLELIRWGWPKADGKGLLLNVQGEKRHDPPEARGLAPFTSFYEFGEGKAPKPKFEFSPAVNEPLALAVILSGGRYVLATTEPSEEVHCVHHRMPAVIRASEWRRFLTDQVYPRHLMAPPPPGVLRSVQVR